MAAIGIQSATCSLTPEFLAQIEALPPESKFIKVDQFGYPSSSRKTAVITNPQKGYNAKDAFTPGPVYELREFPSGETVLSGRPQPWQNGTTADLSGDQGWWFDFSSVTAASKNNVSTYYVYDGTNNVRSAEFEIHDQVYDVLLKTAARVFYYNRCGIAKAEKEGGNWTYLGAAFEQQDSQCRFYKTPDDATSEKDLRGGWWDAGDFNKYVTFAHRPVHDLMWAYRENPTVFTTHDDWNIPESNNGVPDILDELKWELDWLMRMMNDDGSTHIKMGSISYSDNVAVPPDVNTDPRYYGPTCTSASIAVAGMLAHAATVFRSLESSPLQDYWQDLLQRAELAWSYVLPALQNNQLETDCDDGTIKAGDADWTVEFQRERAITGAIYLLEATGNSSYNDYIAQNIDMDGGLPITIGYWDYYNMEINDALLLYTSLTTHNANVSNRILNSFETAVLNNYQAFYGFDETQGDLYRGSLPEYYWGSNRDVASMGILNQLLMRHGIIEAEQESFAAKSLEMLHYLHGVNPQGVVYLTNMYNHGADHCVNEAYHTWFADGFIYDNTVTSTVGPPPGYLVGGPNQAFSGSLSPPANQPPQKSYLDFNSGSPTNSWEVSEPAIYYQAAYVRLVANFVTLNGKHCPAAGSSCLNGLQDGNCTCIKTGIPTCPFEESPCFDETLDFSIGEQDGACNCRGTSFDNLQTCNGFNLVSNGMFDTDYGGWDYWGCTATIEKGLIKLSDTVSGEPWDAAFGQRPLTLNRDSAYKLRFHAGATATRSIDVKVGLSAAPFTSYIYETVFLPGKSESADEDYELTFRMPGVSDANAGLDFYVGAGGAGDVYLDNIILLQLGCDDQNVNNEDSGTLNIACDVISQTVFDPDILLEWSHWNCEVDLKAGVAALTSIVSIPGSDAWDSGFGTYDLTLSGGEAYILSFNASSSSARTVQVKVGLPVEPFTSYLLETVTLQDEWLDFAYRFVMDDPTATNVAVDFFLGLDSADVFIANVSLQLDNCIRDENATSNVEREERSASIASLSREKAPCLMLLAALWISLRLLSGIQ